MRFSLLTVYLLLSVPLMASNERIKNGLRVILNNLEKNHSLSTNPLDGIDILPFSSRSYLLFYRGLGHRLVAKGKKQGEKLHHLERALADFRQMGAFRSNDLKTAEDIIIETTKEYLEAAFAARRYYNVIAYIERLPKKDKTDSHWVLYYGKSLFETKQVSLLKNLMRGNAALFKDELANKAHLKVLPKWGAILAMALADLPPPISKLTKAPAMQIQEPKFSKIELLKKPVEFFNYLDDHFYFRECKNVFKDASALYLNIIDKKSQNKEEKSFIDIFQKSAGKIPPNLLEEFITTLWKKSRVEEALVFSRGFLENYKGHPRFPNVLYDLGRIQEDAKHYNEAEHSFTEVLKKTDDTTLSDLALFRTAWMSYLAERHSDSIPLFARYLSTYPDGRYATTCEYMLIKLPSQLMTKPQNTLIKEAQEYIQKYPLNIYSLMLCDHFNLPLETFTNTLSSVEQMRKGDDSHPLFKLTIPTIAALRIYKELKAFGLVEDARRLLMTLPFDESNDPFMLYLAAEFGSVEHAQGQLASLNKIFAASPHLRSQIPWKALFPDAHVALTKELLRELKSPLSPYLVLAIMRQESSFNAEAKSLANAFGLMQLIPSTASEIANKLQMKSFDLKDKKDNIRLGIATLSQQLQKFNGRLDYALAGYNAGPMATQQWIDLRGHLEPWEFIESIPYQETRYYIKNVMRNFLIYEILYEQRTNTRPLFELAGF